MNITGLLVGQNVRKNSDGEIGVVCDVGAYYFLVEWHGWTGYYDFTEIGNYIHLIEPKDDWTDIMVVKL